VYVRGNNDELERPKYSARKTVNDLFPDNSYLPLDDEDATLADEPEVSSADMLDIDNPKILKLWIDKCVENGITNPSDQKQFILNKIRILHSQLKQRGDLTLESISSSILLEGKLLNVFKSFLKHMSNDAIKELAKNNGVVGHIAKSWIKANKKSNKITKKDKAAIKAMKDSGKGNKKSNKKDNKKSNKLKQIIKNDINKLNWSVDKLNTIFANIPYDIKTKNGVNEYISHIEKHNTFLINRNDVEKYIRLHNRLRNDLIKLYNSIKNIKNIKNINEEYKGKCYDKLRTVFDNLGDKEAHDILVKYFNHKKSS